MNTIDPGGELAPYLQLANILRTRIESGDLEPGSRVPSINQLAADYGVARMTAHKAARLLISEGRLVVSQGRGMFVPRNRPPNRTN